MNQAPDSNSPEPSDSGKMDSRLASFLRKASPIIHAERGINARSRVKLESMAQDMKLPEELFEQGLQLLQEAPSDASVEMNRWEQAFAKRLRNQLSKLKGSILTAGMEQRAIQVAQEKYQLDESQARRIIQQVTKEENVGRISVSEAERHLEELVQAQVGDSFWIEPSKRELLHREGKRWGVRPEQIETLVAYYMQVNRERHTRKQKLFRILVGTMTITIFVSLAGILLLVLQQSRIGDRGADESATSDDNGGAGASDRDEKPDWWTESIEVSVVKGKLNVRGLEALLPALQSRNATERGTAYRRIVGLFEERYSVREERDRLAGMISDFLILEPNESAHDALIDSLLTSATPPTDELPADRVFYDRAMDTVELIAKSGESRNLSESRQKKIQDKVSRLTGVIEPSGHSPSEVARRHQQGHCRLCYRALINVAAERPKAALSRLDWLRTWASSLLDEASLIEFESQFLLAAIPFDESEWSEFRRILGSVLNSDNPTLYRFITLAETTNDRGLRDYLFVKIASVLDVDLGNQDAEEIASLLRRRLGVVPGIEEDSLALRRSRLRRRLDSLPDIDRLVISPTPPDPQQIADVMRLATLACALAQSPPRLTFFDRELNASAPDLNNQSTDRPSDTSNSRRPNSRTDRERLRRFVDRLQRWEIESTATRLQAFKGVSSLAANIDDIDVDDAEAIAKYILALKSETEHLELLPAVNKLSQWPQLLIGVADQIDDTQLPPEWMDQIMTALCNDAIRIDGASQGLDMSRRRLLETALERLTARIGRESPTLDQRYDRLQEFYRGQIEARAALLASTDGSANVEFADSNNAQAMLQLVQRFDRQIARSRGGVDTSSAEKIAAEIKSLQYLNRDDFHRTVAAQRMFADRLSELVRLGGSSRDAQAELLLDSFDKHSLSAEHVATQLYLGEWIALQLWLLELE